MKRIVFENSWQDFFAEHNLKTFDDFAAISDRSRTNPIGKNNVAAFSLEDRAGPKEFFIKCFYHCHGSDVILSLINFGCICSQSEYEWRNAKLLLFKGIKTYQPVCFGEQKIIGIEKKSFVVTQKLNGQSLTAFVKNNWTRFSDSEKEKIIILTGRFVRKIHDAGFGLPDLYMWHLFIQRKDDGEYELAVIDLQRMERNVKSSKKKIRNLGRLFYSMSEEYFDDNMRSLLIGSYVGDDQTDNISLIIDGARKYSARLSAKRNIKPY